jgi:hypothetical protein
MYLDLAVEQLASSALAAEWLAPFALHTPAKAKAGMAPLAVA